MESFEGILIVTTNAGNRIDSAFQRRMDVIVEFRQPEPAERYAIWQLHLPQEHCIESGLLSNISASCVLNGGQIRNAVLHASLLALSNGGKLTSSYLISAIQREYRKIGAACPLQRTTGLSIHLE
jgi:SpoVK/Ycf46/Vps4 family AAA+-type ATPase